MDSFEKLLLGCKGAVERYVYYKIPIREDAEDILQDTFMAAQLKFHTLRDTTRFKAWLLAIARNQCNDYFRKHWISMDVSIDTVPENQLAYGWHQFEQVSFTEETLRRLKDKDQQILYLYFYKNYEYREIARKLGIPEGTVKSRMHTAKEHFRKEYSCRTGDTERRIRTMKTLPEIMPHYTVERLNLEPFAVTHRELAGMLIIPQIGEKLSWGMYDFPARELTGWYQLEVTGAINVHGVEGVEIQETYTGKTYTGKTYQEKSVVYAQLTEDWCRYLGGTSKDRDGVSHLVTFLDAEFEKIYAIGSDNCGFPVNRRAMGQIVYDEGVLYTKETGEVSDIVGRYKVTMNGREYDTIRLVEIVDAVLTEQYINSDGRTILWRRFNRDDWELDRYDARWTEQLPDNERLMVNGETYVHWYDCLTDYVLQEECHE